MNRPLAAALCCGLPLPECFHTSISFHANGVAGVRPGGWNQAMERLSEYLPSPGVPGHRAADIVDGFAQVQGAYRPDRCTALVRPRPFGDPGSTGCAPVDSQSVKDSQQPSRSVWPEGGQDELHTKSAERVVRGSGRRLGAPSRTTWHSLRFVHTSRPDRRRPAPVSISLRTHGARRPSRPVRRLRSAISAGGISAGRSA